MRTMATMVGFETHSTTEDNEQHVATGWHPGQLSDTGRRQTVDLGQRIRARSIGRSYASDLGRAIETARLAAPTVSLFSDWRLRECHYGDWSGADVARVHAHRAQFLHQPYPGGTPSRQQRTGQTVCGRNRVSGGTQVGDACIRGHHEPHRPYGGSGRRASAPASN